MLLQLARQVVHKLATVPTRSPKWRALEKRWLKLCPYCAACGGTRLLQVHHVTPFEHDPALELDEGNLLTLCMARGCHLLLGHGDSFRFYFPGVRTLAKQVSAGTYTAAQAAAIAKARREPIHTGA